jgi:hypothetical protein
VVSVFVKFASVRMNGLLQKSFIYNADCYAAKRFIYTGIYSDLCAEKFINSSSLYPVSIYLLMIFIYSALQE